MSGRAKQTGAACAATCAKRNRLENIKVSDDCAAAFAAMAKALRMSKAALFEDLVAERLKSLQRRGVKIEV